MMSAVAGIGQIRFRDTHAEAKKFFDRRGLDSVATEDEKMKQACEMVLDVNTDVRPIAVKGDRSKSVLFDASILAKELKKLDKQMDKWKVMCKVWVELLSYAASHCRADTHAQVLSKGGEFVTVVWLLMAHLGIGEQFQINEGHARAKLMVGDKTRVRTAVLSKYDPSWLLFIPPVWLYCWQRPQPPVWDTWNLRGFIILSLSLQTILIFFAPFRKRTPNMFMIFLVWSVYLLADWAAAFAVGLISNSQGEDSQPVDNGDLLAFWAPFLLVHLGGPDTITAFALEDNALWLRHLIGLLFQVFAAFYVFLQTLPDNKLLVPTILMLLAGIVKYAERTRALYLASLDKYKASMLKKPDPGPNYAKLMDEYASKKEANLPTRIDMIAEPKKDSSKTTAFDDFPRDLNVIDSVKYAYQFYEIFKGLIVDLIFSFHERNYSRSFFQSRTADDAYNIRFRDTHAEAKKFFDRGGLASVATEDEKMKKACKKVLDVNTDVRPIAVKGDRSKSVLFDASILAKELKKLDNQMDKWKVMCKVWVELLSYAASHCRADTHAHVLSKGGEFVTVVWLLMAHLGIGEQFQINEGHARAKLMVGK
ncbi:hypothetical protein CRG98_006149 [Punica granatum]|uniref:DUF4220 domain-containing protein n=1 Tax=Punica granatum TaxID=22663 RepID=A0A2I0KYC7_PUNGR|nr:hypothetical protein CRG98_006149 [Punica granatum]